MVKKAFKKASHYFGKILFTKTVLKTKILEMFLNLHGENSHPGLPFGANLLFFGRTVCPSEQFCLFLKYAIVRKQGPPQRRDIYHWISQTIL